MRILAITLILFTNISSWADEPNVSDPRTCRVLFLNKPAKSVDEVYLFDGEKSQHITLSRLSFSKGIKLPAGPLMLYVLPEAINQTEELPHGAPAIQIAGEVKNFYLLLESDSENEVLPIRLQVVDLDKRKIERGETLWINHTEHNISAELGNEAVMIPASGEAVSAAPLPDHGYYLAEFKYQRNAEGDFLPVMRKSWWFDANSSYLGFIENAKQGLPKIFTLRDRREP